MRLHGVFEELPSYDFLNGPSGTEINDFYTPEIAFNAAISDLTTTMNFDELRGVSILNEIGGKGSHRFEERPRPDPLRHEFPGHQRGREDFGDVRIHAITPTRRTLC